MKSYCLTICKSEEMYWTQIVCLIFSAIFDWVTSRTDRYLDSCPRDGHRNACRSSCKVLLFSVGFQPTLALHNNIYWKNIPWIKTSLSNRFGDDTRSFIDGRMWPSFKSRKQYISITMPTESTDFQACMTYKFYYSYPIHTFTDLFDMGYISWSKR
jgi:hypothetical protein